MSEKLLDLNNVSIVFGGLRAVSNLNMYINRGELVASRMNTSTLAIMIRPFLISRFLCLPYV